MADRPPPQVFLRDEHDGGWLHFRKPGEIIETSDTGRVLDRLRELEEAVEKRHLWAAGFLSYEAGPGFDTALLAHPRSPTAPPLLWFGLFEDAEQVASPGNSDPAAFHLGTWAASMTREEYECAISRIKTYIADGESYQVNYTMRLQSRFDGDPWALFAQLEQAQSAGYAAYVDTGRHVICSASPELFFRLRGRELLSKPMKGTAARGRTLAEDREHMEWLRNSEKNRAENVMIVDMVRNDMGRIANIGTVRVPKLCEVERYPTVLQMTSTVVSQTDEPVSQIFAALFPCASVTGAPKARTMEIIRALEPTPREVYTGSIGYLAPGARAQFNVAIRTVTVDRSSNRAEYGVGGGIVWDSDAEEEYQECRVKAKVLQRPRLGFRLLESLLWEPQSGYFLLDRHLDRLSDSAEYFGIPVDRARVRRELDRASQALERRAHKVRLLVDQNGSPTADATPLDDTSVARPVRVAMAEEPVDPDDPFLYHKTTRRGIYEEALASRPQYDDVLLWNTRGEVTESSIANLVVRSGDELVTPPVECGLLPGTYRRFLLEQGIIRERVLTIEEIKSSREFFLINSVRRWVPALFA